MPRWDGTIIFAGLIGGILWNLLTWLFGIPSSSSHALFGGLIGAGLAALGLKGVNWPGVTQKVLIPGGRAADRRAGCRVRHLAGLPHHPESAGSGGGRVSAGVRSRRPPSSPSPTAPMTRRRPWV